MATQIKSFKTKKAAKAWVLKNKHKRKDLILTVKKAPVLYDVLISKR